MKTKVVLFDLDGTLLPMDQELFTKAYFGGISKRLATSNFDADRLIQSIWKSTIAMMKNDGKKTNEDLFWEVFSMAYGEEIPSDEPGFAAFYREDFDKIQPVCGFNPKSREVVDLIKSLGFRTALATNPIFPAIATEKRVRWAGLNTDDFELITSYGNSHYCKPNPDYYVEIMQKLGVRGEECLMVGNDVDEDMVAQKLGMKVFLLTDCLLNKKGADISVYPHGGFEDLTAYVKTLV